MDQAVEQSVRRKLSWRSCIGPGLITGASDDDPSGIATYSQAGARFGWSPDARVSEWVPAERARLSWVLKRMWRIGCTETLARQKALPGWAGTARLLIRSIAILVLRTAGLATLLLPGARRVDIAGQWVKSWGRLYALAGRGRSHREAGHYGAL